MKTQTILPKIKSILYIFTVTLLLGYLVILAVGFKPYSIVSGSMSPSINVGDIVYIRKIDFDDIHKGDVITYTIEDTAITHRVVKVYDDYLITKGDNNSSNDTHVVHEGNVVGKVYFTIPYLGYLTLFLSSMPTWLLITLISVLCMSVIFIPSRKGETKYERKEI